MASPLEAPAYQPPAEGVLEEEPRELQPTPAPVPEEEPLPPVEPLPAPPPVETLPPAPPPVRAIAGEPDPAAPGFQRVQVLRAAGFSNTEIEEDTRTQMQMLLSAGFTPDEVAIHYGNRQRDDSDLERLVNASGLEQAIQSVPELQDPTLWDALRLGMDSSVAGLLWNEGLPDSALAEDAGFHLELAHGVGVLVPDLPLMILGGTAGGGPITGMAGAFALPGGIRQVLMDSYSKGQMQNWDDFGPRLWDAVIATGKEATIGAATGGAGKLARVGLGKPLERMAASIPGKLGGSTKGITEAAAAGSEVVAMVGAGGAVHGEVPEAKDFALAAITIGFLRAGHKGVTATRQGAGRVMQQRANARENARLSAKFRRIYVRTGLNPREVVEAARRDPTIIEDLSSVNIVVPRALQSQVEGVDPQLVRAAEIVAAAGEAKASTLTKEMPDLGRADADALLGELEQAGVIGPRPPLFAGDRRVYATSEKQAREMVKPAIELERATEPVPSERAPDLALELSGDAARAQKPAPVDMDGSELVGLDGTPVPVNTDGTITVYHRTSAENAESIRDTGVFHAEVQGRADQGIPGSAYFSTKLDGQATGYGDTIVELRLDPSTVRIDDAFHGGEVHVSADLGFGRHDVKVLGKRPPTPRAEAQAETGGQLRAAPGGEIGENGEFYKGGQFIATQDIPKKHRAKLKKSAARKEPVELGGERLDVPLGKMPAIRHIGTTLNRDGSINQQVLDFNRTERGIQPDAEHMAQLDRASEAIRAGDPYISIYDNWHLANGDDAARLIEAGEPVPSILLEKLNPALRAIFEKAIEKAPTPRAEGSAEPWQMTREEFNEAAKRGNIVPAEGRRTPAEAEYESRVGRDNITALGSGEAAGYRGEDIAAFYVEFLRRQGQRGDEGLNIARKWLVQDALREGRPVPPEVLADYPTLAPAEAVRAIKRMKVAELREAGLMPEKGGRKRDLLEEAEKRLGLVEEAQKFDTADEFIEAQGGIMYHGTAEEFGAFDLSKTADESIWFTSDRGAIDRGEVAASGAGRAEERVLRPGVKLASEDVADKLMDEQLIAKGYRGIAHEADDFGAWTRLFFPNEDTLTLRQIGDLFEQARPPRAEAPAEPWQMTREEFATPVPLPVAKPGNIVLYHRLSSPEHLESVMSEGLDISKKRPGGEGPTDVIWAVTTPSGYTDAGTIIGFEVPKSDARVAGTDQFMVPRSILPREIVYVDKEHSLGGGFGPKRENEQRNSEYAERIHEVYIEKALAEGKSVPPEVLAEYPDLAPTPRAEATALAEPTVPVEEVPSREPPRPFEEESLPEQIADVRALILEAEARGEQQRVDLIGRLSALDERLQRETVEPGSSQPSQGGKDAMDVVLGHISVGEKPAKRGWSLSQFYTHWKDGNHPLRVLGKYMEGGKDTRAAIENEYSISRLFQGTRGKADFFIQFSPFKFGTYERVGRPLVQILKPVRKNLDGIRAYMVSARKLEMNERAKAKHSEEEMAAILEEVGDVPIAEARRVVEEFGPELAPIAKDLYEYQDHVLQYARDGGLITPEAYAMMTELNKNYVPFFRVMLEEGAAGGAPSGNSFFRINVEGSGLKIHDPIESIIKNTHSILHAVERNAISDAYINHVEKVAGQKGIDVSDLATRVKPRMKKTRLGADEMKKLANKLRDGDKLTEDQRAALEQETLDIFRPDTLLPGQNQIVRFKDGERQVWEVPPEIAEVLQITSHEEMNLLVKILSVPATTLRAGAVLSPRFMLANPVRDSIVSFIQSDSGYKAFADTLWGAAAVMGKTRLYQDWMRSGGAQSELVALDRVFRGSDVAGTLGGGSMLSSMRNVIRSPLEGLRVLSQMSEQMTRVGEFGRALHPEKGTLGLAKETGEDIAARLLGREMPPREAAKGDIMEAGLRSRDVSLDFGRVGSRARAVNRLVAFLNASLEGTDKMLRTMKDHPTRTMLRGTALLTVPALILQATNQGEYGWSDPILDDEGNPTGRYKPSEHIPQWQRDMFFVFPTYAEDDDGNILLAPDGSGRPMTIWHRIPAGYGYGMIFKALPQRLWERIVNEDPHAFDDYMESLIASAAVPFVAQAAIPFVETWANRSLFTGAPQIPAHLEGVLPEFQATPRTTSISRLIGGFLSDLPFGASQFDLPIVGQLERSPVASPMVIEDTVRALTGGLGTTILRQASRMLEDMGILPEPPGRMADTPSDVIGLGAFAVRTPSGGELSRKFWDRVKENDQVHRTVTLLQKQGRPLEAQKLMQKHAGSAYTASGAPIAVPGMVESIQKLTKMRAIFDLPIPGITPDERLAFDHQIKRIKLMLYRAGLDQFEAMSAMPTTPEEWVTPPLAPTEARVNP